VAPGEGESGVREIGGKVRVGSADRRHVRRRQSNDEPVRDVSPATIPMSTGFHRSLDAALDLDRANRGLEDPRGLALEQSLEEPFDGSQGSHVGAGV
jgi:hypothetical protein